jgi:hypothetical protein
MSTLGAYDKVMKGVSGFAHVACPNIAIPPVIKETLNVLEAYISNTFSVKQHQFFQN